MDIEDDLRRCKAEIAKIRNPKRRAAVRKAIRLHQEIMALELEFRILRGPFSEAQVYWSERQARLEHVLEGQDQ